MSSPHQPGPYDPAAADQGAYSNPQEGGAPQQGQYGQPQYGQSPYQQPQYGQGQYDQPQYQQAQYQQGPYDQTQYGQPQYQQAQYQQAPYQQSGPRRAPGEGVMGPFTLRDILILAGALLVLIGSFLPVRHVYSGIDYNAWVWNWSRLPVVFFLVLAPIVAGVLCLIQKLAAGFPKRIGSFSIDQVISAVAIAGAVYNFLFFISEPQFAYVGTILTLIGSLAVVFAASLTMIPAFAADFTARASVEAPPKARPVTLAPKPAHNQFGQDQYGQDQYAQNQYGQDQYGQDQYGRPYGGSAYGASNATASNAAGVEDQSGTSGQGFGAAVEQPSDEERSEYRVADPDETSSHTTPYVAGAAGAAGVAGTAYAAHEHSAAGEASDSYAHPASSETPIVMGTPESPQESSEAHTAAPTEDAAPADDAAPAEASEAAEDAAPSDDAAPAGETDAVGAQESAAAEAQPFWFAVPEERPAFDESGQPLFAVTPGVWFLALEDHGTSFTVRSDDGRVGILHDVSGIQRG